MKREERKVYNSLKKTVTGDTLYIEIPTNWTHEARQAIHELLTVEKGMVATVIGPECCTFKETIRYTHSSEVNKEIRQTQEVTDIDEVMKELRHTDYTWNGHKVNEEEPASIDNEEPATEETEQSSANSAEEKEGVNTMNELKEYCDNIRKELNAIYEGTTEEKNEDGEQMTMWDYFSDVLDYEYTIGSNGDFLGVRVFVSLGGPNVWIDTRRGEIAGAWGTDRAESWLPSEIANEIDDIFREYYEMTRN